MPTYLQPLCDTCRSYLGFQDIKGETTPVCAAFPNGIPQKIYYESGDHTKPWKGDNGIQYQAKTTSEE